MAIFILGRTKLVILKPKTTTSHVKTSWNSIFVVKKRNESLPRVTVPLWAGLPLVWSLRLAPFEVYLGLKWGEVLQITSFRHLFDCFFLKMTRRTTTYGHYYCIVGRNTFTSGSVFFGIATGYPNMNHMDHRLVYAPSLVKLKDFCSCSSNMPHWSTKPRLPAAYNIHMP
jgi:hypothetical protein